MSLNIPINIILELSYEMQKTNKKNPFQQFCL